MPTKIRRRFSVEKIFDQVAAIAINLVQDGMYAQRRTLIGVGMDEIMLVCRIIDTLQFTTCVFS